MAQLQVSGAPLSVLIDFGLPENVVERLFEAGIGTVERLGSMTPEEIQSIPGITAKALESIQYSVNAYYGPYEDEVAQAAPAAEAPGSDMSGAEVSGSEVSESVEPAAEPEVPAEPTAEVPVDAAEAAAEPEPEA